jgi:hypothetical protein
MRTVTALILVLASLAPLLLSAQDPGKSVRLADRSDWWSILNENFDWPSDKPGDQALAADNFELAGISLEDDPSFRPVKEKFGQVVTVTRGNASSGRSQVCYVSERNPPAHLIFEEGELNLSFYLFAEGQAWNGQALCAESAQVTSALRTKSGLGLGMSPAEVERILGKPDIASANRLVYQREVKRQTSETKLANLRKEHSEMSDEDFHENFDSYDLETYIEARFSGDRLTYLAVSKAENY